MQQGLGACRLSTALAVDFTAQFFTPGRGATYCDQRVGLSVCPLAYLKDHDHVQLASDYLSKNFPLRGCPINPNEAEFFSA